MAHQLGGTLLCYRAAQRSGLVQDLEECYGKLTAAAILSVAFHWLCSSRNAAWLYEEWAEQYKLPSAQPMDPKEMTEFFETLGQNQEALSRLFGLRFKRIPETDCVSYDSTNIGTDAQQCAEATIGKAKDGTYRNQINLAVCYAQKARTPLMYRIFPGNVADTTTTQDLIDRLTVFSANRARTVVLDRGYFSTENLALWSGMPLYDAIIAAKVNTGWVWDEINNNMPQYWLWKNYLQDLHCYALTAEKTLRSENGDKFTVWLHTFRSDYRTGKDTEDFAKELSEFERKWEAGKVKEDHAMMKYFLVEKDGTPRGRLVQNVEALDEKIRHFGFFGCVTTGISYALAR